MPFSGASLDMTDKKGVLGYEKGPNDDLYRRLGHLLYFNGYLNKGFNSMVWYAPRRYAQDVCINSKMLRKTGVIAHVIFLDSSSIRLRSTTSRFCEAHSNTYNRITIRVRSRKKDRSIAKGRPLSSMKVLRFSPDSEMVLMVQRNSVRINLFLTYDFIANQLLELMELKRNEEEKGGRRQDRGGKMKASRP